MFIKSTLLIENLFRYNRMMPSDFPRTMQFNTLATQAVEY